MKAHKIDHETPSAPQSPITLPSSIHTVPPEEPELGPPACWVAREVYGIDNPRWLEFRAWMLGDAPNWLRSNYIRRGEGWAAWLSSHPRVKPLVRAVMEGILKLKGR